MFYSLFCLQHLPQYLRQTKWLLNSCLLGYRQEIKHLVYLKNAKKEKHFLYHVNLYQNLISRVLNWGVKHRYFYLGIDIRSELRDRQVILNCSVI